MHNFTSFKNYFLNRFAKNFFSFAIPM